MVVGEDLGTVEPWVRDYLAARGVLGTSILWFERDYEAGVALPPEQWRQLCLASVTTHDLPPTAGYLAGEHIRIRDDLGLLTRPVEEERQVDEADRASWLDLLVAARLARGRRAARRTGRDGGPARRARRHAEPAARRGTDRRRRRDARHEPAGHPCGVPQLAGPARRRNGDPVLLDDLVELPFAAVLAAAVRGERSA